jgi:hypothetical protein
VAVEALETPYTGALKSGYEISLSRPGMQLSLTAETDAFLGGLPNPSALGRVDVYHYDESNCWQLDQFLQSGLARLDTTSLAYEENIIILAFGGELRVFYKFAVGADYGPGLETLKGGFPSGRQAVAIPAIVGWIIKKAAMAGTGALMHVGITVAFEKWFGEYDTWGEAWDNSSFKPWELYYAAASGALADQVVLQFFGDIANGMVSYVLNTPTSSFSWEGFFAGGVVTGLADGVLGLLTGGILGDLSNKGKAIFQKYAPNINLTPGGPGGGDPWYRTLKELMGLVPTFMAKPKTFGAWKRLANRASWIRTNTKLLNKLANKPDDFIAKVDDFYKGSSHKLPGGWKNDPNLKLPKYYQGIEFDKYGFPKFKGNQVANPINKVEIDMKGNHNTGPLGDYGKARKALEDKLKETDPNATVSPGSPFVITYNGSTSQSMTWHHMEDGKTMQAVKTEWHDKIKGKHTGGVAFTKPDSSYPELKGLFDGQ